MLRIYSNGKVVQVKRLLMIGLLVLLSGCGQRYGVFYSELQQGNNIREDKVAQLRPGMSKKQVEMLMGTPLLENAFDPNRWDYVYTFKATGHPYHRQHVAVIFSDGRVTRIERS